jgi:hypothetical protein
MDRVNAGVYLKISLSAVTIAKAIATSLLYCYGIKR